MALTTDLVVSSVPPEKAGGASGLATTVKDLGISLGISLIDSVGVVACRNQIAGTLLAGLPADAAASDSIEGALVLATELPGVLGEQLVAAAEETDIHRGAEHRWDRFGRRGRGRRDHGCHPHAPRPAGGAQEPADETAAR